MAPWGNAKLFFCILLVTCYCAVTLAEVAVDCCYEVSDKEVEKRAVADYRRQVGGQGCPIDAVILLTRHERKLCVSPNQPWIKGMMKHVDHLKKFCKQKNYKGIRCFGVKPV
ncbi:eotaxin-like [Thunnus albacares]|uniref:eotaxin-like n=1 Tax=Thunnus albacares TaxID=8236 RepID=UPI001CF64F95|nr:eotaxin-like [Thunnus albacares]